jgi:cytochrome c biogenesis protein CcmG, thiol:disulfide interchange protein DsbE
MKHALLLALFTSLAAGCSKAGASGVAPDFTLRSLDGQDVTLSSLRGRPVLVVFWAVGCPPCRQEVPALIDLKKRYGSSDNGLAVLAVNAWNESAQKIEAFAGEKGINYAVLLNGMPVARKYSVQGIPTAVLIDPEGNIIHRETGYSPSLVHDVGSRIEPFLRS